MRLAGCDVAFTKAPEIIEKIVTKEKIIYQTEQILDISASENIAEMKDIQNQKIRLLDKFLADLKKFNSVLEKRVYDRI